MEISLKVTTADDMLHTVLNSLRGVYGLSPKPLQVLHWLCTKADEEGTVVVVFSEYEEDLGLTQQNFHNNIKALLKLGLISGSRGMFQLRGDLVDLMDVLRRPHHSPLTITIDYESIKQS